MEVGISSRGEILCLNGISGSRGAFVDRLSTSDGGRVAGFKPNAYDIRVCCSGGFGSSFLLDYYPESGTHPAPMGSAVGVVLGFTGARGVFR